jgi:RHS repeat-associated protein
MGCAQRLKQIDSGTTASFAYDPLGRRISKNILGTTTSFLYDGPNAVQEVIGGTNTANSLMGGIDEVFQRTDSAGARSFLTDALGSSIALADSTGTIQTQYIFDPFGNTTTSGSTTTNSFAYTGRELDTTGLYFNRVRYYNPQLQRFISEDPIGFDGGNNFYRYAEDNPVSFTDPFGLDVTVTVWPGAHGFGHIGVGVNTNDTSGFYETQRPVCLLWGCNVPGLVLNDQAKHPGGTPEIIIIHTTPQQDDAMNHAINLRLQNPGDYNLYGRNCTRFVEDVLKAGGLDPLDTVYPHDLRDDLKKKYP